MFGFKMVRRGMLRPWILSMLAKAPKNGAELIDEIERSSWGGWRPSPGSVYPLLDGMVQDGLVRKKEDGRYEITDKGKAESEWSFGMPFRTGPRGVDQMLSEISGYLSYFEDLARTDRSKLATYEKSIKELSERLSKLVQQ
jgi:DNA-binding PadR family transcriptional regulator